MKNGFFSFWIKIVMIICVCCVSACYNMPQKPVLPSKKPQAALPPLELPPEQEIPKYIYMGTKYQDPFIQLEKGSVVMVQTDMSKTGIDPAILMFKGFIKQGSKSMALLNDTAGNTYFLKDMKLVDMKGRVIPGVVGFIKEESILIETDDGVSREIKLFN